MKKNIYKERCMLLSSMSVVALLAFLAGFGFQSFVRRQTNGVKIDKRDAHAHGKTLNTKINVMHTRTFNASKSVDKRHFESRDRTPGDEQHEKDTYHMDSLKYVDRSYLEDKLKYFSEKPHYAGSERELELGREIEKEWNGFNCFDKVERKPYEVLLSLPKSPAEVELKDSSSNVVFSATTEEKPFFDYEKPSGDTYPFNAYSAAGTVEGEYVYVNYGEMRDHMWLKERKVNLTGKILIAKYGFTFRGEKARLAQQGGASGLVLYADPKDYKDGGTTYPDSWDLPAGAIPRGNVANAKGDPLTPLYAAKEGAYRRKESEVEHLAKIPVTPISYADAYVIMSKMKGMPVEDPGWQGGMNFTYHVLSNNDLTLRVKVDTKRELKKIENVVGTILGETEPDRLVIIGNHRDGWVFGAGDPSTGTACMMSVAKAICQIQKNGWRPKRTLMIVSWDAEEHGLQGSVEWVQEFYSIIASRAVAYINVDIAVSGNYSLRAKSSPLLADQLFNVTKKVKNPDSSRADDTSTTVYDLWKSKNPEDNNEPMYSGLGGGSDFVPFYSMFGVPASDIRYTYDPIAHPKLSNYPVYHTIYDNFAYFKKFIDPDFRYHETLTKVWLLYALEMSDALILPFNLTRYAEKITTEATIFGFSFSELFGDKIDMGPIIKACERLKNACKDFHERLKKVNLNDCNAVRRANDQLMQFDRAFIVPEGLEGRPYTKHILFSSSRKHLYSRKIFPSISDLFFEAEINHFDNWNEVREQVSVVASAIDNARNIVLDFVEV